MRPLGSQARTHSLGDFLVVLGPPRPQGTYLRLKGSRLSCRRSLDPSARQTAPTKPPLLTCVILWALPITGFSLHACLAALAQACRLVMLPAAAPCRLALHNTLPAPGSMIGDGAGRKLVEGGHNVFHNRTVGWPAALGQNRWRKRGSRWTGCWVFATGFDPVGYLVWSPLMPLISLSCVRTGDHPTKRGPPRWKSSPPGAATAARPVASAARPGETEVIRHARPRMAGLLVLTSKGVSKTAARRFGSHELSTETSQSIWHCLQNTPSSFGLSLPSCRHVVDTTTDKNVCKLAFTLCTGHANCRRLI